MTNLVFNLRNAKAQASCAKLNNRTYSSLPFREGAGLGFLGRGFILLLLITLGVGQMWGADVQQNAIIYMDNSAAGWDYSNIYFVINNTNGYPMTAVANTKLYVHKRSAGTWGSYSNVRFFAATGSWGGDDASMGSESNMVSYGANLTNTQTNYGFNGNNFYVIKLDKKGEKTSSSTRANLSTSYIGNAYTSMNKTITVKAKVSTDGGSSYSETTSPGTLSASSKKFSNYNTCGTTSSLSSGTISCGYTATTTLTAADASGYSFVGWYNSSGTQQTTSKTLTIYPTGNATYYAYYKAETTYTITIANNVNATTSTVQVGSTPIQITAPDIDGYAFSTWSSMPSGVTITSGSTNTATISITATKAATITANYTEDLSSPWIVAGGNKIVTTGTIWRTTADANNTMLKKTGHSAESVVYFTVPISAVCEGDNNGNYQFKIYNTSTSTWYSLAADGDSYYLLKAEDGTAKTLTTSGKNIELRAYVTGDYEFKLDYSSTPTLTVTWPDYNQLRFYSAQSGGSETNTYNFENTGTSTWTKSVSLTAGTTYWFKVVEHSDFFSNSDTMTRANHSNWTMDGTSNNCGITADVTGTYTFSYVPSTNTLTVTYPTAYTVTYGKGTGGSTVSATATSAGGSFSSGALVRSGDVVTFSQTALSGYTFKGWYTTESGSTSAGVDDSGHLTINATKTVYAQYTANTYRVTFDVDEDHKGTTAGATAYQDITYKTTTVTVPNLPSGAQGYGFDGYYTGQNGAGTKLINEDGTWIASVSTYTDANKKWIKADNVTLYAYYKQGEVENITFDDGETYRPEGTVTATAQISPSTVTGPVVVCWRVLHNNDSPLETQPTFTPTEDPYTVSFPAPTTSTTYKLEAKLSTGSSCPGGTLLNTYTKNFSVSGTHTVTVQYQCNGVTIHPSMSVIATPLDQSEAITAPDIFGYAFSNWVCGDGVTITTGTENSPTVKITATYNGKLTAQYSEKNYILFKNTLGWSQVYVNFYSGSKWDSNGSGNNGVTNGNKPMTHLAGTDIWYYDYQYNGGGSAITPSLYVSFTSQSQPGYTNFWAASPGVDVVYPANYPDAISTDKSSENGFKPATPMFVPYADQAAVVLNNSDGGRANYYNAGYWTMHTPGTGYTLEIYYDSDDSPTVKSIPFTSSDELMPMKAVANLEANTTYRFQLRRGGTGDNGFYYGNTGTMTYADHGQATAWEMINTMDGGFKKAKIVTNAAGDYTFNLSYAASSTTQYRLRMEVDYPIADGDYRLNYKDGVHTKWHPSAIVPKVNNGKDTVSFFIRPKNASRILKIEQASVNASTGAITWSDYSTITPSITSLPKDSVYNINLTMNGSGAISVESVEAYTGNYYIRTDAANSKWDNYRSDPDHLMTYSEYSINHGGYSHYYCHWVETGDRPNVKFCIANDYSPCISDTLTRETASGEWVNIATYIDADGNLLRNANVRYTWYQHDNTIKRAYIDGAQGFANDFLVLVSNDGKIKNSSGTVVSEVKFADNQNWIYEANIKSKANSEIKLRSTWGVSTPFVIQYFKGSTSTTETLITGSDSDPEYYDIRLLYDFKTNRLVAAMLPSGNISTEKPIHADVMFIRDHQGDIAQLNLTGSGEITNIEIAYGVIQFNKWTLNNKARDTHSPLPDNDQLSPYERALYFISFPFDVKLSEVFGFGTYGTHWIIEHYDGAERAAKGFWQGDRGFWKYYYDRKNVTLYANQGYLLALDLDELDETSSVWSNGNERAELFFPSSEALGDITNTTITHTLPSHECTINRAATEGLPDTGDPHTSYNRTIFDSHWNVMSVPTYANTTANSWTGASTWIDKIGPNYIYTWNMDDNSLTPTAASTYNFHAMHAYMVQYNGSVTWNLAHPAAIVARHTYYQPQNVDFTLEIGQNEKMLDRTIIRLSEEEGVNEEFAFNEDMCKDFNNRSANIYSFIDNMIVAGNTLPMTEGTRIIPIGAYITQAGSYTFAMPNAPTGLSAILIDNQTGIHTELGAGLTYSFESEAGQFNDRFFLEIAPIQHIATGIDDIQGENAQGAKAHKVLINGILYIVRDGKMFDARGAKVN